MNCLICRQAEVVDGLTSVILERGEMMFVVNSVPARVCPGCGEAYVDEAVAVQLLRDADEMSRMGMLDVVHEYIMPPVAHLPWRAVPGNCASLKGKSRNL